MSTSIFIPGKMDPKLKALFQAVANGERRAAPYLHFMENLIRLEEVLVWLVSNQITGLTFVGFIEHDCKGSLAHAIARILRAINHDLVERPVIFGKDLRE